MGLSVRELYIEAQLKEGERVPIVQGLSFAVEAGQRLALVGRSGCGKTMTAMAILGLLPGNCHARGSIVVDDQDLFALPEKERRQLLGKKLAFIPQSGADFLNPSLRIRRQMEESLSGNGIARRHYDLHLQRLLTAVGFPDPQAVLRAYPFQLSGGMAQRVVMAMACAGQPRVVIADEPTRGIDQGNVQHFLRLLDGLFHNSAVLLITHDISVAATCQHILVVRDGQAEEYGPTRQVLQHPASVYTHTLICDLPHALSHWERGVGPC